MRGIAGLGHVAIKVTDLGRSLDYYVNKLGFAEMLRLKKDDRSVWLEDPDGNRIELMEMAPDNLQFAAIKRLHAESLAG